MESAESVWREHLKQKDTLNTYAEHMRSLAEEHWVKNPAENRVNWIKGTCLSYYFGEGMRKAKHKDARRLAHETGIYSSPEQRNFSW